MLQGEGSFTVQYRDGEWSYAGTFSYSEGEDYLHNSGSFDNGAMSGAGTLETTMLTVVLPENTQQRLRNPANTGSRRRLFVSNAITD